MRWNRSKREQIVDTRLTRPLARSDDLVVEELGDELLVYDQRIDRAHSLAIPAARVWKRCDGKTTVEALGAQAGVDHETVARALDELAVCDLLEVAPQLAGGDTRREATVKIAKFSGAAMAAPLIASIAVPTAAAAATTPANCSGQFCGNTTNCNVPPRTGCCCCRVSLTAAEGNCQSRVVCAAAGKVCVPA